MKTRHSILFLLALASGLFIANQATAQTPDTASSAPKKPAHVLRDPVDGQFDLSYYMINLHGLLPVPTLITEPALGGIGGALGLVYMEKPDSKAMAESRKKYKSPGWPNTWLAGGMYTGNKSWGAFAGRVGSFSSIGLHYRVMAGYADVNMNFYRTSTFTGNELDFDMDLKTIPLVLVLTKDFLYYFNAGIQYTYSHTTVGTKKNYFNGPYAEDFRNFIKNNELNVNTNSMLSALLTFDNRDNVFTPNNGAKVDIKFDWAAKAIGSDFDYLDLEAAAYGYKTLIADRWVGGLRLDYEQVFNDAPFYALPYVDLRGVPAMRYQGNIVALAEMEHRVRVYKRWSAIGFAGVANAFPSYSDFSDDGQWAWNAGGGFRYLIARIFNLHMGADVGFSAHGDWGFYIIFGSNWLR